MSLAVFFVYFGLLMVAMAVHEFAHGWMANSLGDSTALYAGRLTLNPFAHIDIFWTVILPMVIFFTTGFFIAAAKPVPINYWALRNPKKDIALIGLSGPVANFIFALLLSLLLRLLPGNSFLILILAKLIFINVMLGVFNLVPIPPLDGSRVLYGLLPQELANKYISIEPYGLLIVSFLFLSGVLSNLIWPIVMLILKLLGVFSY